MVELHTAMEVYSVPDLRLVAVVPSADDEVNAAAWHPFEVPFAYLLVAPLVLFMSWLPLFAPHTLCRCDCLLFAPLVLL